MIMIWKLNSVQRPEQNIFKAYHLIFFKGSNIWYFLNEKLYSLHLRLSLINY